jgi:apolipoprotein D and lipocalin family protein
MPCNCNYTRLDLGGSKGLLGVHAAPMPICFDIGANDENSMTFDPGTPMLRKLLCALAMTAGVVTACAAADAPLPVVDALDLTRYVGTWHEIARYPNFFERKCVRDVTAEYTLNASGTIRVANACRKDDDTITRATGVARVVTPPAKLQVRFASDWLAWLPFVWADYWVIDLADDYSYVVVGEPSRDYLWILARGPQMSDGVYARIVAKLPALGYDPAKLIRNP